MRRQNGQTVVSSLSELKQVRVAVRRPRSIEAIVSIFFAPLLYAARRD